MHYYFAALLCAAALFINACSKTDNNGGILAP